MANKTERDSRGEQVLGLITHEIALQRFNAAGTLVIADTLDRVLLGWHRETDATGQEIAGGWGNPAGSKKDEETAWQTALRETGEEFGIPHSESPSNEPLIMVVYEGEPITLETLDIGVCYPIIIDSSSLRPEQMKPTTEVAKFQWFDIPSLNHLTEVFTEHDALWGGCWTEMVLRRWVDSSQSKKCNLALFPGMITFSRFSSGRWLTSYERVKLNH